MRIAKYWHRLILFKNETLHITHSLYCYAMSSHKNIPLLSRFEYHEYLSQTYTVSRRSENKIMKQGRWFIQQRFRMKTNCISAICIVYSWVKMLLFFFENQTKYFDEGTRYITVCLFLMKTYCCEEYWRSKSDIEWNKPENIDASMPVLLKKKINQNQKP